MTRIPELFNKPHLSEHHKSQKLLEQVFKNSVPDFYRILPTIFWDADHFNLNRSSLWRNFDLDKKNQILSLLTQRILATSWWIENAGRLYGAKMILLSQSVEEMSLYSSFCKDETLHMHEFENFINFDLNWELHAHPMLRHLADVIDEGQRECLVLVVQVLLEGFGLAQYQSLRKTCLVSELQNAFDRILKDEAAHHGAGVIFSQEMTPSKTARDKMFEFSRSFINSFLDSTWIVKAIEKWHGPLSSKELLVFQTEISMDDIYRQRKDRFKEMLIKADNFGLVDQLVKNRIV